MDKKKQLTLINEFIKEELGEVSAKQQREQENYFKEIMEFFILNETKLFQFSMNIYGTKQLLRVPVLKYEASKVEGYDYLHFSTQDWSGLTNVSSNDLLYESFAHQARNYANDDFKNAIKREMDLADCSVSQEMLDKVVCSQGLWQINDFQTKSHGLVLGMQTGNINYLVIPNVEILKLEIKEIKGKRLGNFWEKF